MITKIKNYFLSKLTTIINWLKNIKDRTANLFSLFTKKIPNELNMVYIVEGINLFEPDSGFFFEKIHFSKYYMKFYFYLLRYYPESSITKWFIINTTFGTFRVYTHGGKIIMIRSFVLFKNHLFHVHSCILNYNGFTFDSLSSLSCFITRSFGIKRDHDFSATHWPAGVTFDTMAILPLDINNASDISEWDITTFYTFYP